MYKVAAPIIFVVLPLFFNYSYALTPEQVIELKKAGVSDRTIRTMLDQEADAHEREAFDRIGTREIKDKSGNTYTVYSTGGSTIDREEKEKVDRAWEMLENMTIENKRPRPPARKRDSRDAEH